MEQYIEQIINAPHKAILVSVAVIWLLNVNIIGKILLFIQEFKFRDIDSGQVKLLIENDNFNDDLSDSIVEYFERAVFYKAYGIKADKEERAILLEFYSKHQKEISWNDLKRAYENIEFDGSTIIVRSYVRSTLARVVIGSIFFLINVLFVFSFVNLFFSDNRSLSSDLLSVVFIYYILFKFFDFFGWKYLSTIKVQTCIDNENAKLDETTESTRTEN